MKSANPQGKGLPATIGLVKEINELASSPAKDINQIANELFTSMFVLHSDFKFRPVIGKSYWLYRKGKQYRLSLLSPHDWNSDAFGVYIGRCELHEDITWSMELSAETYNDSVFMSFVEQQREAFEQQLRASTNLRDSLPGYQHNMPFYQRAFLTALSRSLGISMGKSGISSLNYEQALLESKTTS